MSPGDVVCPACQRAPGGAAVVARPPAPAVARHDDRVRRHIGTLAIFYYILAVLNGLATVVLFIVAHFLVQSGELDRGDEIAPFVLHVVGMGLLVLGGVFFSIGWGLQHRSPWARILAIIAAFFLLFHLPFGTALGIYTLWVLLPSDSERQYQQLACA
jgi:hypothetical protein